MIPKRTIFELFLTLTLTPLDFVYPIIPYLPKNYIFSPKFNVEGGFLGGFPSLPEVTKNRVRAPDMAIICYRKV